ncbi:MAG: YggT family protein [Alphaproteobacteria bacterium]|nr:YggT family protein [Alphaproteobacteria bacterium]
MLVLIQILMYALMVYFWIVTATVLMSWLVALNIANTRNNYATVPVVRVVRKVVPPMGGFDFTPMVIIFAIWLMMEGLTRLAQYVPQ